MLIVFSIQGLLLVAVGFPLLYLAFLTIAAAGYRKRDRFPADSLRRFVFVVPAHDEQHSIAGTVQSLLQVDYPRELFDVFVLADNCSDGTALVARESGAMVLERTNPVDRGKGHALEWGIAQVAQGPIAYDAFIVVDADSTISRNFLTVMNHERECGHRCIQASDIVAPGRGSWSAEMIRISFLLFNVVRPLGRRVCGLSAGLRGNGMCLSADVLREHPWSAYSRAEDVEFGLQLLLSGVPVAFAPEATVFAVMPQQSEHARSQRSRWEAGRFPLIRNFAWKLLKAGVRHQSLTLVDACVDLVTPPLVNLFVLAFLCWTMNAVAFLASAVALFWFVSWSVILCAALFHLLAGMVIAGADKATFRALFSLPKYLLWKARLYRKLAGGGAEQEWIRTTREQGQSHSDASMEGNIGVRHGDEKQPS